MDRETRNRIQRATQDARALLEREYAEQLAGTFDIRLDGTIASAPGGHLDAGQRLIRAKLVTAVEHLRAAGHGKDAVAACVREAAFTTLNRFVALKMLEARGLVQECLSRGEESSGFKEFVGLAPGLVQLPEHGYRLYIESLFDEIGREVRVLFDRRDPASLLWPRRQPLLELLAILNAADLASVWAEDETIGWVYQYFNSDEERRQMRAESQAPRNSRELAVRNQFFTPRYVVQFLTDNTLGRIWYEMRRGETKLCDLDYLVRRPNEVFLAEAEAPPAASDGNDDDQPLEELLRRPVYVPFRTKKDPRDIRLLDPACGSGHFLLYAFDLLLVIYEEAWSDEASPKSEVTGKTLREDYADLEALRAAAPGLILRHNLHGIDIDPRCAQIAALALWMRAQRAFKDFGIARDVRPPIQKTNIVVAEPMPGEPELRREFVATLDPKLGRLVQRVFDRMDLAGEAGSLLRVEDDIRNAVREIYGDHGRLFRASDEERWRQAEDDVLRALRAYAERAANGRAFQRRQFAEDAARGLGFIDLCGLRYDVVLMNPPFGERPPRCDELFQASYPATVADLFAMFFERTLRWLGAAGKVGVISNRTWLSLPTFEALRTKILGDLGVVDIGADLGSFVLEAQVETAAVVLGAQTSPDRMSPWIRLLKTKTKKEVLEQTLFLLRFGKRHKALYLAPHLRFRTMPTGVFGYWMSSRLASTYRPQNSVEPRAAAVKQGTAKADDFRFLRLAWEVPPDGIGLTKTWARFAKGGEYSPFYDDIHLVLKWANDGQEVIAWGRGRPQNTQYFGRPGVTWPLRTTSPFGPRLLPAGCAFGHKGPVALVSEDVSPYVLLGYLSSRPARLLLSVRLGAGDDAPGSASKSYEVGIVKDLPFPAMHSGHVDELLGLVRRAVDIALHRFRFGDETSAIFDVPDVVLLATRSIDGFQSLVQRTVEYREDRFQELADIAGRVDTLVADALDFSPDDHVVLNEELEPPVSAFSGAHDIDDELFTRAYLTKDALPGELLPGGVEAEEDVRVLTRRRQQFASLRDEEGLCRLFEIPPAALAKRRRRLQLLRREDLDECSRQLVSFVIGVAVGRFSRPHSQGAERFDPLVEVAPPTVTRTNARLLLVDDEGHADDLVAAWMSTLAELREDHRSFEEEVRGVLTPGSVDLRDWLRRSFFDDHTRRYSRSRRKAPIYWQIATASVSYSVWLYYHCFTRDTLYRVLNDYVTPKLKHEERKLSNLSQDVGPNPSAIQRKEMDAQERFVDELRALREEVARVAPLWNPNLNDGVIINFAPLWRLVPQNRPWQKECKAVWDKLVAGEYDWAHLAMHLWPERVIPKCAEDRSLAIAHGLEEVFWEKDPDGKWKPKRVVNEVVDRLIGERTSAAVKAALDDLLRGTPAPTATSGGRRRPGRGRAETNGGMVAAPGSRGKASAAESSVDEATVAVVRDAITAANGGASKAEVMEATGISSSDWNAAINALLAQGAVIKTGAARGTRYQLAAEEETG